MRYLLSLLAVFILFFVAVPPIAYSPMSHGPRIKLKDGTSTNWSGYAALTSLTNPLNNVVSDVKGTWTVSAVDCSGITNNTYSSTWVGIDGYSSNTVEQTGTEQDCINGQPSYYAWYEMYPKFGYKVPLIVQAGDSITGEVLYLGNGQFRLSLVNNRGGSFVTNQRNKNAQRQSVEWIVEAPWSGGVLPLANFGTLPFTASSATINGHTGPISDFANDRINMVASDGITVKASTSALTSGSNFNVAWLHQ